MTNTTQITQSIKFTTTDETDAVKAVEFNIGTQRHAIIFEVGADNAHIVKEASIYVRRAINNAKNYAIIKVGDYNIAVQHEGDERVVYANDEVISRRVI